MEAYYFEIYHDDHAAITSALRKVHAKRLSSIFTADEIVRLCKKASRQLEDEGITVINRVGYVLILESTSPHEIEARSRSLLTRTRVKCVYRPDGWYIIGIEAFRARRNQVTEFKIIKRNWTNPIVTPETKPVVPPFPELS